MIIRSSCVPCIFCSVDLERIRAMSHHLPFCPYQLFICSCVIINIRFLKSKCLRSLQALRLFNSVQEFSCLFFLIDEFLRTDPLTPTIGIEFENISVALAREREAPTFLNRVDSRNDAILYRNVIHVSISHQRHYRKDQKLLNNSSVKLRVTRKCLLLILKTRANTWQL